MSTTKDGWCITRPFSQDPEEFLNKLSCENEKDNATPLNWVESMAVVSAIRYVILTHLPDCHGMTDSDFNNYECCFYEDDYGLDTPADINRILTILPESIIEWNKEFTLGTKFNIRTTRYLDYAYIDVHWGEDRGGPSVVPLYLRLDTK
jgi:hypothetical protein